jgi:hypothetical protein
MATQDRGLVAVRIKKQNQLSIIEHIGRLPEQMEQLDTIPQSMLSAQAIESAV